MAKKATTKKKASSPKKASSAPSKFMAALKVSDELAAIVGKKSLPRTEVTKLLWAYIKKHDLQDPKNKRNIKPDAKLALVLGNKTVNMFEMTKLVSKHLS
jgi:chromatin remodeling complex protein RSC6